VKDHGVASIPVSALYAQNPATNILRLCFAKADDTLDLAVERLAAARAAVV
jgi:aspartate/methionine/tyrosine aminotransferase